MLIFPKQHQEPFSWRIEAPGQLPGSGTSPALGEFRLELSSHSLNGGTWSVTRKLNQSSTGGLSLGLSGHSLNRGTWLVTRKVNQSRTGELSLGLRAILQENGGAWLVTRTSL